MHYGRAISFIIGFALIFYLINRIGFEKIKEALFSLNPIYMLAFFLVLAVTVTLKGLKWKMSLGIFDVQTPLFKAVEMWVIGFSIGAVTPGRVGDFIKIFYVSGKKSKSLGAILLDRITDVSSVLFFSLMGLSIFGSLVGATKEALFLTFFGLIAGVLIIKKYYRMLLNIFFRQMIPKRYKGVFKEGAHDFFKSTKSALSKKKKVFSIFLMSAFIWMVSILNGLIIAKSLNISIEYFHLLFIMSIVALVELIPVTVAGLGTREATIVFLMSFLGIESEKAIVFSLINFIFGYLALALVGYIFWMRNPVILSNALNNTEHQKT